MSEREYTTTCRNCGETREYDPHGGNPSQYCSTECYEEYTTEVVCGECGTTQRIVSTARCYECSNRIGVQD